MIMFGKSGIHRCSNFLPPRATGSQEQRLTILKELVLQGGKAPRIDDFTYTFYKPFLTTEKDHIALCLHNEHILLVHRIWPKNLYQKHETSRMCKI